MPSGLEEKRPRLGQISDAKLRARSKGMGRCNVVTEKTKVVTWESKTKPSQFRPRRRSLTTAYQEMKTRTSKTARSARSCLDNPGSRARQIDL